MTQEQLHNLVNLKASILDPGKLFRMNDWCCCIYGHARMLGATKLPQETLAEAFENWSGVPATTAQLAFSGVFHDDKDGYPHFAIRRAVAAAEVDHWIEVYAQDLRKDVLPVAVEEPPVVVEEDELALVAG